MNGGSNRAKAYARSVRALGCFAERLYGVYIAQEDFEKLIKRWDTPGTLFYCDPPYLGTNPYRCGFTFDDHIRLRKALEKVKGKAMVSYENCPEVRKLYKGWRTKKRTVSRPSQVVTRENKGRKRKKAEELLFINY